jgi:L-iditol 2-dehydrogenase
MHAYAEGAVGDVRCQYPVVLGHEPAGVCGEDRGGRDRLGGGRSGALEPAHFCYHCELCARAATTCARSCAS